MVWLKWTFIGLFVGYIGFLALLYVMQRRLMYFPDTARVPGAAAGLPQTEDLVLNTPDGERVIAWHVPPQGDRPLVLYLHGNGGALVHRAERFAALVRHGVGLLAIDYRGYGGSTGSPSEAGLLIDAQTAYEFAASRYPAARITLWGESLGTGVAVALASERGVARLVLEAPFTSAVDIAALHYPFVPVRLLMKDQFHSDERIGRIGAPLLILHGARDHVVPIEFGERLFALAREPKRLIRYPDGEHEGLDQFGARDAVVAFLGEGKD
jgi:fermentation-respiration switch protein FrsA (DUF1100 family)